MKDGYYWHEGWYGWVYIANGKIVSFRSKILDDLKRPA